MKGMRSICFHPRTPSFASPSGVAPSLSRSPIPASTLPNEPAMDKIIEAAAVFIMKWNPETSAYARVTSLFYENKREAMQFIHCVNDLQKAMHSLVSHNSASEKLVHAQFLMEIAMKRLQKEFYQILSMNRAYLDPESVSARSSLTSARSSVSDYSDADGLPSDDAREGEDSITEVEEASSTAMTDLRSIAECMISSGYGKECVSIYKIIRKSIVDEGIYRLGVEKMTHSQINKMDHQVLELKIKNWFDAVKISMKSLFTGERILCDHVFAASDSIRESCFSEISKEGATLLLGFPELVAKSKKAVWPEKIFRLLDMYTVISENWQEIELIFSFDSTSVVRSQALTSLIRLGESACKMLSNFEATVQKDSSKSVVSDGGVHPLTIHVMNHLSLLGDYGGILSDIFTEWLKPEKSSLLEYFEMLESHEASSPAISHRMAWLILVLLCKLDGKAKHYRDVASSYLFLANNVQHIISKVRASNLQYMLGEEWIAKHDNKVKQFAGNYERLAWGQVLASLPENRTAVTSQVHSRECFRRFNSSLEEACQQQSRRAIPDPKLREDIRRSVCENIGKAYGEFYVAHRDTIREESSVRVFIKYSPEGLENYLSELFLGTDGDGGSSSSTASRSSATPPSPLRHRP